MKAIVLAGGRGTRLQKVVSDLPKPLAPVRGQPFVQILIRFLKFHGIDEIILSTHHMAEKFEENLQNFKKLGNVSIAKEPAPLGTGGAVRFVCQKMNPKENILVLNGDTYFDFDLKSFLKKHGGEPAMALKEVSDCSRYGTVEVKGGNISKFVEKAPGNRAGIIYAGYSVVNVKDILTILPEGSSSLEQNFFPTLLTKNMPIKGEIYPGKFIDIGIPEDYAFANNSFDFSKFA